MKAVLKFKIPKEKDEHYLAIHGVDYYCSLLDLDDHLRSQLKHNDKLTIDQVEFADNIRDKLREIMDSHHVSLDDVE